VSRQTSAIQLVNLTLRVAEIASKNFPKTHLAPLSLPIQLLKPKMIAIGNASYQLLAIILNLIPLQKNADFSNKMFQLSHLLLLLESTASSHTLLRANTPSCQVSAITQLLEQRD